MYRKTELAVAVPASLVSDIPHLRTCMHVEDSPHWRFQVTVSDLPLGQFVKQRGFDLTVATSRLGTPFANVKEAILTRWKNAYRVLLVFGAPARGLYKIAKLENEKINL